MTRARVLGFAMFAIASSLALWADGVAGIQWTPPSTWKNEGSRPMRAATYRVPPAAGDAEAGECVAYFFGQGQGGGVDANIKRWEGQFKDASGQPAKATNVKKSTVNGIPVTTLEIAGSYSGMAGPMAPAGPPKTGYRMLGAIAEGPGGSVFFKFTAPAKTIAANQKLFARMIATLKPGT